MPTKLPRLNVVIEPSTYQSIEKLAKKEKMSMSLVARDLLKEALVLYEDAYWAKEAEARERSLTRSKARSHASVWHPAK